MEGKSQLTQSKVVSVVSVYTVFYMNGQPPANKSRRSIPPVYGIIYLKMHPISFILPDTAPTFSIKGNKYEKK